MSYPSSSNNELNNDMLLEILSRASLETVDTCKILSKEMQELINDPGFLKTHTSTTKNILGYLVETTTYGVQNISLLSVNNQLLSFKCLTGNVWILASSLQGILCCSNLFDMFVCKPSTNQLVALPSPQRRPEGYDMFGHIALIVEKSKPLRYKIVRFFDARRSPHGKHAHVCEIFDSEIWMWRGLSNNLLTDWGVYFTTLPAVAIGRTAFWLMTNDTVLAFDSTTDTFSQFPGPELHKENRCLSTQIVEYKGKLGFTCVYYEWNQLLLWCLEDSENHKWKIKKDVKIDRVKETLIGCDLADIGLMIGYRQQFYKLCDYRYPLRIFPFRSDWNAVDLEDGSNMLKPLEF